MNAEPRRELTRIQTGFKGCFFPSLELFLTIGSRVLDARGLPVGQPDDFPRGLGGLAGVSIANKTPAKD